MNGNLASTLDHVITKNETDYLLHTNETNKENNDMAVNAPENESKTAASATATAAPVPNAPPRSNTTATVTTKTYTIPPPTTSSARTQTYSYNNGNFASVHPPPPGAPAGGQWGTNNYVGEKTGAGALVGCLCFCLPGLLILLCPFDERDAYTANGKVYDASGRVIGSAGGTKFKPSRR